ncbi:general substrate transporter [Ilyonectria robusta]|uniref:general substrate transporter n=1 Tax=Ilyonectria robusta TaxID=1079257 RepID=UPI001E8EA4AE|nr:general substrate transporter [Ilyonectria robusta]KAH8733913.1 general substrate transporter [Ilyonectria robusta]
MSRLGTFRASYLVALSCIGSFLFAYDTGIVGGVLSLESFQKDMGMTPATKATVSSNSASLLQAGAFFACFFVWPFTAKYGRRWSIVLASFIFNIGAILQLFFPNNSVGTWYAGRTISGLGVGIATVIIPMYSSEMAPKEIRGRLGSMFQFFFTLGVFTSYWIDYAVAKHMEPTTLQWRIPVALQLIPGGFLGLGMLLTKESTRWLAKMGQNDEALESLVWVRGGELTPEVQAEMDEILAGIADEERVTEGLTWKEFLLPANRGRMLLVITLQIGVQLTGNTSLAYFSPQIFNAVGAGENAFLFSGFFGLVKVVSCFFFLMFLVEKIGRRGSLIGGSFMMGVYMLIVAVITATHPPDPTSTTISSASVASLTMIYLEAMTYNISWGPVPWLYMSEIFPTRIREGGIAVGTATQWLWNFAFSQITPHAIENLGWKTFLMFSIFNFALVVYSFLVIKETKGRSLEEMEILFNAKPDPNDVEKSRDTSLQHDEKKDLDEKH